MGLFFDQDWFDGRLKAAGLNRGALAQAAGLSIDEVEMVFRDQRELESGEVVAFARVLDADPREVASRSGSEYSAAFEIAPAVAARGAQPGQTAGFVVTREVIAGIHERIDRLERMLEMVLSKLDRGR
jgi:hypothetical protein